MVWSFVGSGIGMAMLRIAGLVWGRLRPASLKNSRTGLFLLTLCALSGFESLPTKQIKNPHHSVWILYLAAE